MPTATFCPDCVLCPRLASFLAKSAHANPDYHSKPVAPFGVADPQLLIVGLAPGMHGANRTGRPFTGDYAGILLYESLYQLGSVDRRRPRWIAATGCSCAVRASPMP